MDKGVYQKECFLTLAWTIENFSCWKKELHGYFIKCESKVIPGLELFIYPLGVNGFRDRLEVFATNEHHEVVPLQCSDVSLFLFEGGKVLTLSKQTNQWPPHHSIVENILKTDNKIDEIVLEYRVRSSTDGVERICTTIFFLEKYLTLTFAQLNNLKSTATKLGCLQWKLDDEREEFMDLQGREHPDDSSKISLQLVPTRFFKSVFVLTRVLSEEPTMYLFSKVMERAEWESTVLLKKQVAFVLIYYLKIVPSKKPTHVHSQDPPENMEDTLANRMMSMRVSEPSTIPGDSLPNRLDQLMTSSASGWDQQNYRSLESNEKEDMLGLAAIRQVGAQRNAYPFRIENPSTLPHMGNPVHEANQITNMPHPVVPEVFDALYNDYANDPSWENLKNLYCAAVQYMNQDLVQQLAPTMQSYLTVTNMCDALELAILLQDPTLLREVHLFFTSHRQEALMHAQWASIDRRLACMFLKVFDRD